MLRWFKSLVWGEPSPEELELDVATPPLRAAIPEWARVEFAAQSIARREGRPVEDAPHVVAGTRHSPVYPRRSGPTNLFR